MISRRSRIQAKPIIAKAAVKKEDRTALPVPKEVQSASTPPGPLPTPQSEPECPTPSITPSTDPVPQQLTETITKSASTNAPTTEKPLLFKAAEKAVAVKQPNASLLANVHSEICTPGPRSPVRQRTLSVSTTTSAYSHRQRKARKFTGDEKLDPKKMRMSDLIIWNPRNEKALERKHFLEIDRPPPISEEKVAAPQLKLDSSGKLVIDEGSLVVNERLSQNEWQVIDDDRSTRKINSMSFRNKRRGTSWSEMETEVFYEVLRATGSDFGLMHEFFPDRSRNELKAKFNREERINLEKVNEVLSKPSLLEDSLYERVERMIAVVEEEQEEKKKRKGPKGKKEKKLTEEKESEEWNEDTADLQAEAEETIRSLIAVEADSATPSSLKRPKTDTRNQRKKPLSKKAKELFDKSREEADNERWEEERECNVHAYPEESSSSVDSNSDEDFRPSKKRKARLSRPKKEKAKKMAGKQS